MIPFIAGIYKKEKCEQNTALAHKLAAAVKAHDAQTAPIIDSELFTLWGHGQPAPSHNRLIVLSQNQGAFLGSLYPKDQPTRVNSFQSSDIDAFFDNPTVLADTFWGVYSGVIYNQNTHTLKLLRDPIGLASLHYIDCGSAIIFSNHLSIIYDALEKAPSVDWSYMANYLYGHNDAPGNSPFTDITAVLPGQCVTLDIGAPSASLFWDPSSIKSSYITDTESYEEEIRHVISTSLKAWLHDSPGATLMLSGGLDSSALLIMAKKAMPDKKIIAVNYSDSRVASSIERSYAEDLAKHYDVPFYHIDWAEHLPLESIDTNRYNAPSTFEFNRKLANQFAKLADEHGAPTLINGQGGDHLFLAPPPNTALSDAILEGSFSSFSRYMSELSAYSRTSLMTLAKTAAKGVANYTLGRPTDLYFSTEKDVNKLITPAWKSYFNERENQIFLHNQLRKRHPAKAQHLKSIYHATIFSERDQYVPNKLFIHPLLSQPLVELAFRCPVYQTFGQHYDRIFLRRAVAKVHNHKNLWRQHKGETSGSMLRGLAAQHDKIHDIVINGTLAKEGLIDKAAIEKKMAMIQHGHADNLWPFLKILTTELWLKQWNL